LNYRSSFEVVNICIKVDLKDLKNNIRDKENCYGLLVTKEILERKGKGNLAASVQKGKDQNMSPK